MAENPYAKYATPQTANPYAKYAAPQEHPMAADMTAMPVASTPPDFKGIEDAYRAAQQRGDKTEQERLALAYVQKEHADNPTSSGVNDAVRSFARGIPFIGEYSDEIQAGLNHPFDAKAREMNLDYERAQDKSYDMQHPTASLAGKIAGGIGGTIAALPAAAATGTSAFLGAGAKTIPGLVARGGFAGLTQGVASGLGRDGTLESAGQDGLTGAAIGAVLPAALSGAGAGIRKIASQFDVPDVLSAVPAKARQFFESQFSPENMSGMQSQMARLGPQAVMADVSPEMLMMARGAASIPGSRGNIVQNLTERNNFKNQRINTELDASLGPVAEPSTIKAEIGQGKKALSPVYETALDNAKKVDTQALANDLDSQIVDARGPVRSALQGARNMLNVIGSDALDPSPRALFETRKALDGMIGTAVNSGDKSVVRALQMARDKVDGQLGQSVPGIKKIDAQYADFMRQGKALDIGPTVLNTGPKTIRPFDMASQKTKAGSNSLEWQRLAQGTRAEIDRIVGQNANDVSALKKLMKGEGDWNRGKLRLLFGKAKADRILNAIDAESTMENTYNTVVHGSQTSPTDSFRGFIQDASKGNQIPTETTTAGLVLRGGQKLLQKAMGTNAEAKAARFAKELGNLSVASGKDADAIIKALLKRQSIAAAKGNFNGAISAINSGTLPANQALVRAMLANDRHREGAPHQ